MSDTVEYLVELLKKKDEEIAKLKEQIANSNTMTITYPHARQQWGCTCPSCRFPTLYWTQATNIIGKDIS